ncbi:helix-turn-helix domain-containing protein [Streptomyces sp. MMS20-AI2-20]|uniref:helix-turn-helix transcriptional regulator n=1 Tax=unclassified Streptomyces TaxID=2593676 RepID=UPI001F600334|nr:helix-turn-helix domain-containing protein [Streptomyces sp. MMS20-AI2-20]MCI4142806.1 helix-turn-helix domain-containing protein [Streptomyces sp. MMS20-AI2-20]
MTALRNQSTDPRAVLRGGLPERYLTPEDLVTMFSLPSVETVYAWRRKRLGPPAIRIGKYLRYDPAVVHAWAQQQTDHDAA